MKSIADLEDFVNSADVYSFLETYLELIDNNVSLELPSDLNIETLPTQWQDILPFNCKNGSSDFYSQLAILWFELVDSYNQSTSDTSMNISNLLKTLHRHKLKGEKFDSFAISKGYVLHKKVNTEKSIYDISFDYSDDLLNKTFKNKNAKLFLIELCKFYIASESIELPKSTIKEKIKEDLKKIITAKFGSSKDSFLNDLTSIYFILINSVGFPVSKDKLKKYIHYLLTKK